eukprot:3637459-Pleurochrysis_carterae.AAC.1
MGSRRPLASTSSPSVARSIHAARSSWLSSWPSLKASVLSRSDILSVSRARRSSDQSAWDMRSVYSAYEYAWAVLRRSSCTMFDAVVRNLSQAISVSCTEP